MSYPTLTERKQAKVAEMRVALAEFVRRLGIYAAENGGRYVLFGSAARDDLRHDSDVDVVVDFPVEREQDAWLFAERRAWNLGLTPDLRFKAWSGPRLLSRIEAEGRVIS